VVLNVNIFGNNRIKEKPSLKTNEAIISPFEGIRIFGFFLGKRE
jgi:hypothetical protein